MAPDVNTAEELECTDFEVGGELVDSEGNRWAVPSGNVEDRGDLGMTNPLAFPADKMDKRFHYQWIRLDQWPRYKGLQFVRVTEKEMGRFEGLEQEYGKSPNSYIEYMGTIAVKCPKFIYDQLMDEKDESRQLALDGTQPTEQMLESARRGSVIERQIRKTEIGDEPVPAKQARRSRRS